MSYFLMIPMRFDSHVYLNSFKLKFVSYRHDDNHASMEENISSIELTSENQLQFTIDPKFSNGKRIFVMHLYNDFETFISVPFSILKNAPQGKKSTSNEKCQEMLQQIDHHQVTHQQQDLNQHDHSQQDSAIIALTDEDYTL